MAKQATLLFIRALIIGVLLNLGIQAVSDSSAQVSQKMRGIQQLETTQQAAHPLNVTH